MRIGNDHGFRPAEHNGRQLEIPAATEMGNRWSGVRNPCASRISICDSVAYHHSRLCAFLPDTIPLRRTCQRRRARMRSSKWS